MKYPKVMVRVIDSSYRRKPLQGQTPFLVFYEDIAASGIQQRQISHRYRNADVISSVRKTKITSTDAHESQCKRETRSTDQRTRRVIKVSALD